MALAMTQKGDPAAGAALAATTPGDCYLCLRVRGQIATTGKNWVQASDWFARAVAVAPSIPFAYADWGQMLLAKKDPDAAIAKFTLANRKGPHFADPLEMWGEALMAKNRADLALAKFTEADKYAPNWGRLHLKWGEALTYAGKKDEAQKQFALAAGLDLSAADKAELARQVPNKV
jgi:tetratricopeptide (TPR) repeat protein